MLPNRCLQPTSFRRAPPPNFPPPCHTQKDLDFLHCYHHSIVPFSAWLGFCGYVWESLVEECGGVVKECVSVVEECVGVVEESVSVVEECVSVR